jgi:glutaredoxin
MLHNTASTKLDKYHKKIQNKDVEFIVFYKNLDMCPFSNEAINLLKKKQKSFKAYCVDDSAKGVDKRDELLRYLIQHKNMTGFDVNHKTLPIIFKNGKFIGGYTELASLLV